MSFGPGDNLNTHSNYFLSMVGRLKTLTTFFPARRATRADPLVVLRNENTARHRLPRFRQ